MKIRNTLVSMVTSLFCACSSSPYLVDLEGADLASDHTFEVPFVEPAMRGYMPKPHDSFVRKDYVTRDQKASFVEIRELIKKSITNKDSIEYVEDKLNVFEKLHFEHGYDPVDLARDVINIFHMDISHDMGNGFYTLRWEVESLEIDQETGKFKPQYGDEGQSIQTLDEFRSRKSSLINKYEGDCDDFSMALLSCYEIARNLSESHQGESEFWDTLAEGLMRYQIVVFEERDEDSAHSLNASLIFNKDFTQATLFGIEPQCFRMDGSTSCPIVILRKIVDKGTHLIDYVVKGDSLIPEENVERIYRFFNAKMSYRSDTISLEDNLSPK